MRSIRETALAFDRACRRSGVRYALVGGFAVMAWGQPRATTDVDALTRLDGIKLEAFVLELSRERLRASVQDLQDMMREGGHATVLDEESNYHVDLKPARNAAEREQVDSAQEVVFDDGFLRVASAEHTIAFKIKYGSERDLQDARSILSKLGPDLDQTKLDRLALQLGVRAKLDALRRDVPG